MGATIEHKSYESTNNIIIIILAIRFINEIFSGQNQALTYRLIQETLRKLCVHKMPTEWQKQDSYSLFQRPAFTSEW